MAEAGARKLPHGGISFRASSFVSVLFFGDKCSGSTTQSRRPKIAHGTMKRQWRLSPLYPMPLSLFPTMPCRNDTTIVCPRVAREESKGVSNWRFPSSIYHCDISDKSFV
jgi:hypothetical protein